MSLKTPVVFGLKPTLAILHQYNFVVTLIFIKFCYLIFVVILKAMSEIFESIFTLFAYFWPFLHA
jgi:hypothetical protein